MTARTKFSSLVPLIAVAALAAACSDGGVSVRDRTDSTGSVTPTTGGAVTGAFDPGPIEWGTCTDDLVTEDVMECATMTVPLDYSAPDGDTIDIALVRAPASSDREGAVLFNPGGPGGSGFSPIAINGTYLQSALGLEHFDLVGFDPRGVDRSGGIKCVDDAYMDEHAFIDDTPDTPEEQALYDDDSSFDDACTAKYGDTLRQYSTENTARDMDAIRVGLGDQQITYLGISYGTYLGGVYATLFPDNVRAMVLDSAYEPNGDTVEEQYLTQLVGFENAFNDWAAWCESDEVCEFHAADVGKRWDALRVQLDEHPLTADDGREINQATLDTATSSALYSKSEWPALGAALATAENGDGAQLIAMADAYNGRNDDGTWDSLFQSFGVIRCASGITTQAADDPEALLQKIHEQAPRFGADVTLDDLVATDDGDIDGCSTLTGAVQPVELGYEGDGPIVVIGGTNDPATPIRWAEEMTAEMGPSARMVTFTGEGHGQLLSSTCVTDIEAALLADLTLPDDGTVCDPDPVIERPDWFGDIPIPAGIDAEVVSLPAVNAVLGLTDTTAYGELHLTSLSAADAADALDAALKDAGFSSLGSQDIGIDDSIDVAYSAPDGGLLLVLLFGPRAWDDDQLSSAKDVVPEGKTVVLFAYVEG